ncbi:hypothetical protein AGMMS50230_21310 [Spirochaetia bacterium]|nr:hypothetical protein AGMMS50230_21310 [Spirochaetia bacterium]
MTLFEQEEGKAVSLFFEQQLEFTRKELDSFIDQFNKLPLISVIMPVYNTPEK